MTENKNLPLIIICGTIILSLFIFSRTGIFIKSVGGTVDGSGKVSNTISVSGDGKVSVKPDMVTINIAFSELAPTSQAALDKVNQKISEAMQILKTNNIPDTDITTNGLNVNTEYDYNSNIRKVTGQRASESLTVKVKKIDDKASKAAKVIDQLSAIDNVQMNGITFDVDDKTAFFTKARELAFKKAQQKAEELARLSGVSLQKPVSISDTTYDVAPPLMYNSAKMALNAIAAPSSSDTQISTGQLDITSNLSILWGIN